MKPKDFVDRYGFDPALFEQWIPESGFRYRVGPMGGLRFESDQDVEQIAEAYAAFQAQFEADMRVQIDALTEAIDQEREDAHRELLAEAGLSDEKLQAMGRMVITSGFNFEGFRITKYSGYISGDDVIQINRGRDGFFSRPTNVGEGLMAALVELRRNALFELKSAAYDLGCNAVIGVDFDYLTFSPETATTGGGTVYLPYVFGVTANGNAVRIEKSG